MSDRYVDVSGRHNPHDPRTAASPFAPDQPGRGVVADDVPDAQNPAGGPKASEVDNSEQLDDDESSTEPARSATKAEWVDYAVSQGEDRDTAESVTKQSLIDTYGT